MNPDVFITAFAALKSATILTNFPQQTLGNLIKHWLNIRMKIVEKTLRYSKAKSSTFLMRVLAALLPKYS